MKKGFNIVSKLFIALIVFIGIFISFKPIHSLPISFTTSSNYTEHYSPFSYVSSTLDKSNNIKAPIFNFTSYHSAYKKHFLGGNLFFMMIIFFALIILFFLLLSFFFF